MANRICLINPPYVIHTSWGIPNVFQPLGLAYLAAVLEKKYEVTILDACIEGWRNLKRVNGKFYMGLSYEEISSRIREISPQIVGVSVPFSISMPIAMNIATLVKKVDENIITILGGTHPTVRPEDVISHPAVDIVVIGEGEETLPELLEILDRRDYRELEKVAGIAYLKEGKELQITHPRPGIKDLDSLPLPARRLLPMEQYFASAKRGLGPRPNICKPWASVITSRGCPYNCVFCSNHLTMGRKWRKRSPGQVVEELEKLVSSYGIVQIDFEDDNIALDRKRMEEICTLIIKKKLPITWYLPNGVRADNLDEQLLSKMRESGCEEIWISPESGVQRVVDQIIKKKLDLKKVEEIVKACKKSGVKVGCFFVIGFIGETMEDIKKTLDYAQRLERWGAKSSFNIATPYYGTELYRQAKQGGFLRENFNYESLCTLEAFIDTPEFKAEQIKEILERTKSLGFTRSRFLKALKRPDLALNFFFSRLKARGRKIFQ